MLSIMSERGLRLGEFNDGPVPRCLAGAMTSVDSSSLVAVTIVSTAVSCAFKVESRLDMRLVLSRRWSKQSMIYCMSEPRHHAVLQGGGTHVV